MTDYQMTEWSCEVDQVLTVEPTHRSLLPENKVKEWNTHLRTTALVGGLKENWNRNQEPLETLEATEVNPTRNEVEKGYKFGF